VIRRIVDWLRKSAAGGNQVTCVIAMREGESVVHVAADRALSGGLSNVGGSKLVRFPSGLLVGFSGALATQNVMVTCTELVECDLADEKSIGTLYNKFQGIGAYQPAGAQPKQFWAEMLLAKHGNLVYMGNVAGWHRVPEPVRAIGDGDRVALGSWYEREDLEPKERLERAIEVAAAFMPGVVSKECDYQHT
jgi:hypothetical protein